MNKINYSHLMEDEIKKLHHEGRKPSLLLHSCCAPCSSAPLEILCESFDVTVMYYNPNIYPEKEYYKRCEEQKRFCKKFIENKKINFVCLDYCAEDFKDVSKGLENEKELGARCTVCYRLRLEKCACYAAENGFDYFTTTLSVSPLKCAVRLNTIGTELAEKYGIKYLFSDFKKKNGYKRSCELSEKFGMYRQDYCGCVYSMTERYLTSAVGFIFDADGTLCDTMEFYETFLTDYLRSLGITPAPDLRELIRGCTISEACTLVRKKYSISKTLAEIMTDIDMHFTEFYTGAKLKHGVKEFLDYAKSGGIRMCVATATERKYIELMLKANGIEDYFEFIITSSEVGRGKSFPDIYNIAIGKLGCDKKSVIVFEDAFHAVKTAHDAGFKVFAVKDKYQSRHTPEILENSDIYLDSMADLIHRENL